MTRTRLVCVVVCVLVWGLPAWAQDLSSATQAAPAASTTNEGATSGEGATTPASWRLHEMFRVENVGMCAGGDVKGDGTYCILAVVPDKPRDEYEEVGLMLEHGELPGELRVYDLSGDVVARWAVPARQQGTLALVQADTDPEKEVLLVCSGSGAQVARVILYDADGSVLWTREPGYQVGHEVSLCSSVDVDGDGQDESLTEGGSRVVLLDNDGTVGFTADMVGKVYQAAIGDLGGDGSLEIVVVAKGRPVATHGLQVPVREMVVLDSRGKTIRKYPARDLPGLAFLWCIADVDETCPGDEVLLSLDGPNPLTVGDPTAPRRGPRIVAVDAGGKVRRTYSKSSSSYLLSVVDVLERFPGPEVVVATPDESNTMVATVTVLSRDGNEIADFRVLQSREYEFGEGADDWSYASVDGLLGLAHFASGDLVVMDPHGKVIDRVDGSAGTEPKGMAVLGATESGGTPVFVISSASHSFVYGLGER